jgi:hypothetical protein
MNRRRWPLGVFRQKRLRSRGNHGSRQHLGAREKDCVPYREPGANPPAQVRVRVVRVVVSLTDNRVGYIPALRNLPGVRLRETVVRMLGELVVRMPMRDRQPGRPKGRDQADDHRNYSRNAPMSHD